MTISDTLVDALRVEPVHPTIGAVVHGVDAAHRLDDKTVDFLRQALLDHKVIFLRRQHLDAEQQARFAEHFGVLQEHPIGRDYPDFEWLAGGVSRTRADNWHSDMAFLPDPPIGTILSLPIVPEVGGDTLFADLEAAYLGLSSPVRELVDGLTALHDGSNFQDWAWGPNVDEVRRNDILSWSARKIEHPLVHVHPETGRKTLYAVTGFARRIKGVSDDESAAILDLLATHSTRAEYVVRYRWQPGDLAFWDNRAVLHRAVDDYGDAARPLQRVTIAAFGGQSR